MHYSCPINSARGAGHQKKNRGHWTWDPNVHYRFELAQFPPIPKIDWCQHQLIITKHITGIQLPSIPKTSMCQHQLIIVTHTPCSISLNFVVVVVGVCSKHFYSYLFSSRWEFMSKIVVGQL